MEYRKLGKFLLSEQVAKGGMGEIFRSVDDSGRTIALKKIAKEYEQDPEFRELFEQEAKITFQLEHPNIIKAFGFNRIGNQLVLALEFLDGRNLKDILFAAKEKQLKIPLAIAWKIFRSILMALDYAHHKRDPEGRPLLIIHRDINPSNIFLTYLGEVKVLDFGIGKMSDEVTVSEELTPTGKLRGKVCYLAPEQIRGDKIDHRVDIFSAALVFWEMLSGEPLFYRDSQEMILETILKGEYRPLSSMRSDIPVSIDKILMRALSRRPRDRFKSGIDFLRALDQEVEKLILPQVLDEDLSIFVRSMTQTAVDDEDPHFLSGHAYLLTQMTGLETAGLDLAEWVAKTHPDLPLVQLNLVRALLSMGRKKDSVKILERLARLGNLEEQIHKIWVWMGVRRPVVVPFLKRRNPINRTLGKFRHLVLGPLPGQELLSSSVAAA